MKPVQILPFVNQFVAPPRLEVLVDWTDDWHADDPFAGATFRLAHGPAAGAPQAPDPQAYTLDLQPLVAAEVREQLAVVGADADDPATRAAGISQLAPGYVSRTVAAIGGTLGVTGAMSALGMAQLTVRKPQLFAAANFLADLERWTSEPPPERRGAVVTRLAAAEPPRNGVFEALTSVVQAANGSGAAPRMLTQAVRQDDGSSLRSVVRSPQALSAVIDAAARNNGGKAIEALEEAVRTRAVAEQLVYAEALRREQIYSQVRSEERPKRLAAMTATGDNETRRHRRADVRRVSRDEPVVGAIFHVLRWFAMPGNVDAWSNEYLWVLPFRGGAPMPDFIPVATRVARTPQRLVTILRRDELPTYFAQHVTARQIAPALLLDDVPAESFDPADRLRRMIATGQSCPPFHHGMVNEDHPAFALNTQAHEPQGTAAKRISADPTRELADAAESIRRNAPPHDTIGITWERALTSAILNGEHETLYHTGFKGYRIDVREAGTAEWKSLCTVEREVFDDRGEAVVRTRLPREGYVMAPVQNHSADKEAKPTVLTMPADFVEWAGGSLVAADPLDRLGESLKPSAQDCAPVSLREMGSPLIYPRYGLEYEFRVRGVGLVGTGPDASTDPDEGAHAKVAFKRGVPLDAPPARLRYVGLMPMGDDGKPVKPGQDEQTPDVPLLATSSNPRLEIETSLPLAHWRVALHARGLKEDELVVNRPELKAACDRFVQRSRENWRRRIARVPGADLSKPAACLNAVDPHCAAIEVVTRAWFPFSTNPGGDRSIVIGRESRRRDDVLQARFSRLVAMGEEIVDTESFDDRFLVPLDDATLPSSATEDLRPRLLAGFHCSAEVAARWSDDAVRHYQKDEGWRRWTRQVFAGTGAGRPIGGKIALDTPAFAAGGDALVTPAVLVDAVYSAIADLEDERNLVMPQLPQPTGPTCDTPAPPPAHAEPVRWRKIFFDRDCAAQPATDACLAKRSIYSAFVAQQLGGSVDLSTLEDSSGRHRNQLAVCLAPRLVPPGKRSLVLPVFTFPIAPTYEKEVPLPSADGSLSTVVKLGDFGSAGVTAIHVDDGGSGYAADENPAITFDGGGGSGARASTAKIEQGAIKLINIDDGGRDYVKPPAITIAPPQAQGGRAARATATDIGPSLPRKLPWVDADVVWTVRLAWRVPLAGSGIERPHELAAVREFRLFRHDKTPNVNDAGCSRPIATLTRPGHDLLQDIDLDQVEFTWVDAITDRDRHDFEYSVVAVPEDSHTFKEQVWYKLNVLVPDSRIAARPESVRFLPMLARRDRSEATRSLAIYFSDTAVRSGVDHLTYFFARAADDPMLAIEPQVKVAGARPLHEPMQWSELFPGARIAVTPVKDWSELQKRRKGLDGIVAQPRDCTPASENRRSRVFVATSRIAAGGFTAPVSGELGNPFFKLHLHAYADDRFPALAHTAASEAAESDWLQFYPDDLRWTCEEGVLNIASPWGRSDIVDDNHVWYRFHFFAPATDTLSFHVSTFYSHAPELYLDSAHRSAILTSFKRYAGTAVTEARLFVRAEEGILADTYKVEERDGVLTAVDDSTQRFVVLRSTPETKEVQVAE